MDTRGRRSAVRLLGAVTIAVVLGQGRAAGAGETGSGAAGPVMAQAGGLEGNAPRLQPAPAGNPDAAVNRPVDAGDPAAVPQSRWRPPADRSGLAPLGAPKTPILVKNGADGATHPGVSRPATFELAVASRIDQVMTYHYGARKAPGTIALRHRDGTVYGPWPAAGAVGQGGVANAYWWVRPEIAIPAGRYTVVDSDPGTWSREAATEGSGIFVIWGVELR